MNAKPQHTILDTAALVSKAWGAGDALTPRWEATLRALYGLPLRDQDVDLLRDATQRSEESIRALSDTGRPMRELWARVGRRGRKTSSAALIAVHEAVWGGHEKHLLPGEKALIAIVSKDTAGSQVCADFAERVAEALGLKPHWSSIGNIRTLEMQGTQLRIACFPCNATAPRGFAIPIVICDEIAHWQVDPDQYVDADTTILTALRAPMMQFSDSKLIAISTPCGIEGEFHETVEANIVDAAAEGMLAVQGPTWLWNPAITEARSHEIEKDPRRWAQECAALAGESAGAAFALEDIEAAFVQTPRDITQEIGRFCVIDASSLKRDAFTYAIGAEMRNGEIRILEVNGWEGAALRHTDTLAVVDAIATRCKAHGCAKVWGDQRDAGPIGAQFAKPHNSIQFTEIPWTNRTKDAAGNTLGRLLSTRKIHLPVHEKLRKQMIGLVAQLLPSGLYRYPTNSQDYLSAIFTMAHAIDLGSIRSAVVPGGVTLADVDQDALGRVTMGYNGDAPAPALQRQTTTWGSLYSTAELEEDWGWR